MGKSLRTRLTLAFISLAIGPILVIGLVLSYRSVTALKQGIVQYQQLEAARVAIAVENYVHELERVLELTARAHGFLSLDRVEQRNILEELLSYENRFEELTLLNNDGKELIRSNRIQVVSDKALMDRSTDPAFQQVMQSSVNYFSAVEFSASTGEPYITLAIPLQSFMTGKTEYVLLGLVRLKKIWDLLAELSLGDQTVFIVDQAGNIVGHPDPSVALSGKQYLLPSTSSGIATGLAGNQVVMAAKRIVFGGNSLYIIAQQPVTNAMVLARNIVFISLFVIVISLLVAVYVSSLVIARIIRPLQHLSSVARNIQQGDLNLQAECTSQDEVGDLARAFNAMTQKLQHSISSLEKEIDERRQAEKATALALERFKTVMDSLDALVYVADMETYELLFINKYGRDIWGDITGNLCWQSLQSGLDGPCPFCTNDKLLDVNGQPAGVFVWEFQDIVSQRWYHCRDQAIKWTDARFVRMEIAVNISVQKEMEGTLADEKERLAVTLRSIGDGVITTDISGNIVLINKVAEKLTGWNHTLAVGRPLAEVFHIINEQTRERCENPVTKVLGSGQIIGLANHTILVARDGTERSIADSGAPILDAQSKIIGVVLVFRDVTGQIKMEKELLKIEKLESVGVLAGGIAHDFNNILAAILGNINLALLDEDLHDETRKLLATAEKASLRAKDLTQQLLTFAKGGEPIKEVSSLERVIKDSANFVVHGDNVACLYDIPEDLWLVEIDKGQISQVIQNIVINARHAMPQGGHIRISCENLSAVGGSDLPLSGKERFVKMCIQDTGIGIPANVLDRIFDPYFTTKHEGSGLGLAISQSIINKHGGYILVESSPGVGTTFTISLPASVQASVQVQRSEVYGKTASAKILIMDDESMVRNVVEKMLVSLGHEVVLAENGEDAITLYQEAANTKKKFDLVIMDLTIPGGMGGKEAVHEILNIDPDAKVIVSSGYSNDPIMANYKDYGFSSAIVKPYQRQDLVKVISQVLDEALPFS